MSKINNIIISNFKFFSKEETIHLGGKHLLLYGENGSGKSSIFWGLYTLLEASFKTPAETEKYFIPLGKNAESLVNINAPLIPASGTTKEHSNSYIKVQDDNSNTYELSLLDNHICGDSNAQESRIASDFINYQSIFKFQDFRNSETPNLYNIFLYSILPYVTFSSFTIKGKRLSNAGQMWSEYIEGPGYTTNYKGDKILVYKNSKSYKDFCDFETHFNTEFKKLIDFINVNAKIRLKELGYNMDFQLIYGQPSHHKKDKIYEWNPFKIELEITQFNGKSVSIKKPHVFLNEAKISALATAIRLTILDYRVNTTVVPNALKVLILDDLMISLDMSNREPLLDLLLKEYATKYQILFLIHDKNLYTFVDYKIKQHKQDALWIRKEMYVGENGVPKHEAPVIIDGECDSYVKAQKYYAARDYTAAALYIRKSIEEFVTDYLPEEYCKNADGRFIELNKLWQRLLNYTNSIPSHIIDKFNQSRLMILNSSVHYQKLSLPIYRRELLQAIALVNDLRKLKIQTKVLLVDKSKLIFKHPTMNYSFEFELKQNMIRGENENPLCRINTWQYNGIEYYDFQTGIAGAPPPVTETKMERMINNLTKISILGITKDIFLANTYLDKGTLKEALE
jgi:energy-coupling factor transporter ATP-binding protein EcfA2